MAPADEQMKEEELPLDPDIERLWLEEAEKRQREVKEGRAKLVPGDEVMRRLSKFLADTP
jgi:hypothetical protein